MLLKYYMMYIREKLQKKIQTSVENIFHPKLDEMISTQRDSIFLQTGASSVDGFVSPNVCSRSGGDSVATLEEIKQFLWNRDFVHTASGVKFTLRTSQSADADQKLTSLPLQMCCSVAAHEVQRKGLATVLLAWLQFPLRLPEETFWMIH